jgi:hypothetical protein
MVDRRRGLTYAAAEKIALALPGVEAGSSYGTPGLRVQKKFLARLREPDVLVLTAIDDIEKEFLLATQPETFFITDHYAGHPTILIRLSKVDRRQLKEMFARSWHRIAGKRLLAQHAGEVPLTDAIALDVEDA